MQQAQLPIFLPDRFDMLQRRLPSEIENIVVPVVASIEHIKLVHRDMTSAGRGAFVVFRGDSGTGKSTFLNTLGLFLDGVEVSAITADIDIQNAIMKIKRAKSKLRVIIIEGREALSDKTKQELEKSIHSINHFLRSENGEKTLVAWAVNTNDLVDILISIATHVGAETLLGIGSAPYIFSGPTSDQYIDIASRTIATLNQGASLADFGVSLDRAKELVHSAKTVGSYLRLIRSEMLGNQSNIELLTEKERCRLWVVVVAGNEPEGDISGLTRGTNSSVDIERLLGATNANIIRDLKSYPDKLGILGSVLDAKILHLPAITSLAIARDFADEKLRNLMTNKSLSTSKSNDSLTRLQNSSIAKAFRGEPLGTRATGPTSGSNTKEAFRKLTEIATSNDPALNNALGSALVDAGFLASFKTEQDFGTGMTRRTDILGTTPEGSIVRLEIMWRAKTGRAEIANYTLTKLFNYGKAIGFLS